MRIYDLFCTMPPKNRHSISPERSSVIKARGNLLLTCRQIHQEFAPNFYRSADITIPNWWASSGGRGPRNVGSLSKPVADFERLFLRTLATYKLQYIRRLELDASTKPEPLWMRTCASADYRGIHSLTQVIPKHLHNLKSLCEITIFEMPQGETPRETWLPPILDLDRQSRDKHFWDTDPEIPEWDIMAARYLQSPRRSGFLRSWTLTKGASLQTRESQTSANEFGCLCLVKGTGIIFRKTKGTKLPLPVDKVVPKLVIEWEIP